MREQTDAQKAALAKARAAREGQPAVEYTVELAVSELSDLDAPIRAWAEAKLVQMPNPMMRAYVKALQGGSRAMAIKAFCCECVCWERKEVTNCTGKACPLYPYRPYQGKKEA